MSDVQHTLASSVSLVGTSLHTGEKVTLTLHPAPVGFGRKFKRVDLPDEPVIHAHCANVKTVERATTLAEGSVKVQTVEHVLSALSGLGVDNVLIEMNANEPPIGDGSANLFVTLIKKAGTVAQDAPRAYFQVNEPIALETSGGSVMMILPDDKFRVSCTNVGPDGRFTQFYSTEITPKIYETEIAPARTFVYYEDVKPLLDKGLIKGGSLENAVVVKGDAVLSKEPVRFKEEFARHKILDIVGDLALFGRPIKGHVVAVKPGHGPNTQLAKILTKKQAQLQSMVPPSITPQGGSILDIHNVMQVLPHRYPFLMVDRVVEFSEEGKCTGVKSVTINEPYFQGHFPGHPVMPGVLQLEAMAQVASIAFLKQQGGTTAKIGYFMSADAVKFRKPVLPGDTLFIHVEVTKSKRNIAKASGRCIVNGEVVSQAEMMFGFLAS
ncbi:MAG TPA: bifunctional UDP-3-O-[3-hydroxymyristoyl] N-acetylglucosamine deacetylase/3-hydroxyacyl-ACP dehydratase [Chthoniobacteraceae bacterium]|nr:bifunctional UDP-3-O-[3-hydroxymyristoyl] N-acetylglucosamine deacetylase/3-hydroxyacyl-ACP dehydratase [Chthoniobacteraceae bacterium]